MVAEPVRETGDPRRVVKLRQQSRSGDVPDHQEDRAEKRNQPHRRRSTRRPNTPIRTRPSTSRLPQNQHTDKNSQIRTTHKKSRTRRPDKWIWVGPLILHVDVLRKTHEMNAHSEKFMNVSDMQVPDEDDRHDEQSRNKTVKANSKIVKERIWTLVSCFANKIVTEQIWIISVTSKIALQPLDTDTDAHLHEENVISVRK